MPLFLIDEQLVTYNILLNYSLNLEVTVSSAVFFITDSSYTHFSFPCASGSIYSVIQIFPKIEILYIF